MGETPYKVDPDSLSTQESGCEMDILNSRVKKGAGDLHAELQTIKDNMFRLRIREKSGLRPRYEVEGALVREPEVEKYVTRMIWWLFRGMRDILNVRMM